MLNQVATGIRLIINGTEYSVRADGQSGDAPILPESHGPLQDRRSFSPPAPGHPLKWRDGEAADQATPTLPHQYAFSRRTALVSIDVVRAVLGVDAITVGTMVDAGELAWVFDISATKGSQRELRFWTRELFEPEHCRMSTGRALQMIMGKSRQRWRGTEIEQLLLASRASILRWNRAGDLPGETVDHTFWVSRESLATFLKSRLCHRGEN